MTRTVFTARDRELLTTLNRFRAAHTETLHRLFFAPARVDTALCRLRQLRHAGLLDATRIARTDAFIWKLGSAGRAWLRGQGIAPGRYPGTAGVAHHVAITDTWSHVASACHARPGFRLAFARPDWESRSHPGAVGAPGVVPDLFTWIQTPLARHAVSFELDRGTERLLAIRQKLDLYAQALANPPGLNGATDCTLVFVLVDVGLRRAQTLQRLLANRWSRFFVVPKTASAIDFMLGALDQPPQPTSPLDWGPFSSTSPSVQTTGRVFKPAP